MDEQIPSDEEYRARAAMLRLLNTFGNDDQAAFVTTLDAVMKTDDQHIREVLSYLAGTTYGLFMVVHGLEITRAVIQRELNTAEDLAGL
jgi:hypothetical protein